jgi:DsbE subfamily thiol:disulfide oxidoreductase
MGDVRRLVALVALSVVACTGDPAPRGTVVEAVSEPLPALEGPSVVGDERLSTADLRGSILVINVWATWCEPCRRELPAFARVAEDYAGRGVRFLGINYQDDRAAAAAWIERDYALPYPSIYDRSGESAAALGFPGLPDTFFVDEDGTMRFRALGEISERQLRSTIDRMLEG